MDGSNHGPEVSLLAVSQRSQVFLVGVGLIVGLGLGVAAPYLIGWAGSVDWLPFQGPMRLLERLSAATGSWILILIGGLAGALVALGLLGQLTAVRVTDRDITFIRGRNRRRFARSQVSAALIEDKHLVLRDERDADLVRDDLDVGVGEVVSALRRHGWPLQD